MKKRDAHGLERLFPVTPKQVALESIRRRGRRFKEIEVRDGGHFPDTGEEMRRDLIERLRDLPRAARYRRGALAFPLA